jgi:hypothetical protein
MDMHPRFGAGAICNHSLPGTAWCRRSWASRAERSSSIPISSRSADVYELLSGDMSDKAILCRQKPEWRADRQLYSSAVMLLDCGKLTHWDWEQDIDDISSWKFDARALALIA